MMRKKKGKEKNQNPASFINQDASDTIRLLQALGRRGLVFVRSSTGARAFSRGKRRAMPWPNVTIGPVWRRAVEFACCDECVLIDRA